MKKLFTLFAVLSLVISGCTKDIEQQESVTHEDEIKNPGRSTTNLHGSYFVTNKKYHQAFASDGDLYGDDHCVEARPYVPKSDVTLDKFTFTFLKMTGGFYYIVNEKYQFIFAASGDTSGGDHIVEARPDANSSDISNDKFKWYVEDKGSYYLIRNKAFGYMFAADGDMHGSDHIIETRPNASYSDKNSDKFKWYIDKKVSLNSWMSNIPGTKYLSELSIPGTHESCAKKNNFATQCQEKTITEQLNAGVRFFDIRCKHTDDYFVIYHYTFFQDIFFGDVLNECYSFLNANPNETLIISVKKETDSSNPQGTFQQQLQEYIDMNPQRWFLENRIPQLNEVRGKIVLYRRFEPDATPIGIEAYESWMNDSMFNYPITNGRVYVQDNYDHTSSDDKWNMAESQLNVSRNRSYNHLSINFTSAAGSLLGVPYPLGMANGMNPRVSDYLYDRKEYNETYGIIAMDFYVKNINRMIIDTNF